MKRDYREIAILAKKIKQGDEQAFSRLYELTYQKLYFFCYSILGNREDAQDALQETYIKIIENIHTLENDKLLLAWINRIAYSRCMKILDKKRSQPMESEMLQAIIDEKMEDSLETQVMQSIESQSLHSILKNMDSIYRSVLILKYFEDLKISQISFILRVPEGTVKRRLHSARNLLKKEIQKKKPNKILYRLFAVFAIREGIYHVAKDSVLEVQAAEAVFEGTLEAAGLSQQLSFQPQIVTAAANSLGVSPTVGVSTAIVGVGAAAVGLGLSLIPPGLLSVQVNETDRFTNEAVVIAATVKQADSLKEFYATLEETDEKIKGTATENNVIQFKVDKNGSYTIHLIGSNEKETNAQVRVSRIDQELPVIQSYTYDQEKITIYVNDNLSGIDYSSIYGKYPDGTTIYPTEIDEGEGKICFAFPEKDFKLYMKDLAGNESVDRIEVYVE
ncbi:MAG: RNA polymerase sigma factor [Lachnospiraceae bacterium]